MIAKGIFRTIVLLAVLESADVSRAGELPVETFFRRFAAGNVKISPDGKSLAVIRWDGTNCALRTVDLASRKSHIACTGNVMDYEWVSGDRLVVLAGGWQFGGMFAVDRDGTNIKVLVEAALTQARRGGIRLYDILDHSQKDYPFILVSCVDMDRYTGTGPPKPVVRRVNVLTGKSEVVEKNPGTVVGWFTDRNGQVRLAVALKKERGQLLHRPQRGQPWEVVHEFDIWEDDLGLIGFAPDNRHVYVAARAGQDTLGLYAFDPVARSLGECLWRDPQHDLFALYLNSNDGQPVGVYCQADRLQAHWFGLTNQARAAKINRALSGMAKFPVGETEDGSKTVYFAYSDRVPGAYYLFDPEKDQLVHIADVAPWVNPAEMADMKPVSYAARDGLTIHGYLTLPQGKEPKGLPFIVLPHGGPWVQDTWGFDPEAQFLANRGYAVLQPNYRSSTGYGLNFVKAGYKQYGLKIQDDITDGVQWAIREGIADPKRVAIFGCSFGGYATMVGLTQTPELYRCGINYAGITDLNRHVRYATARAPKLAQSVGRMRIGDYRKEKDLLKEVSPLNHVEKIQAPVMLIYGGDDEVVDIEQGRRLEKELKAKKKTYEFVYEPDEGHGFTTPTNVFKLYNRIDAFLRKHMQE